MGALSVTGYFHFRGKTKNYGASADSYRGLLTFVGFPQKLCHTSGPTAIFLYYFLPPNNGAKQVLGAGDSPPPHF